MTAAQRAAGAAALTRIAAAADARLVGSYEGSERDVRRARAALGAPPGRTDLELLAHLLGRRLARAARPAGELVCRAIVRLLARG